MSPADHRLLWGGHGDLSGYLVAFCMLFLHWPLCWAGAFTARRRWNTCSPTVGEPGIYRFGFIALAVVGACVRVEEIWNLSDLLNGLMAVPNLIALALLSPVVFGTLKEGKAPRRKKKL